MQRLRFSSFTWILLSLFGLISCRPEPPIEPVEPAEVAPLTDAEQVIADALDGMVVPISSSPFDITDTDLQVLIIWQIRRLWDWERLRMGRGNFSR
ncbi:MAG: hypothetical protein AAF135_15760 [Bacteroidota bacterium]